MKFKPLIISLPIILICLTLVCSKKKSTPPDKGSPQLQSGIVKLYNQTGVTFCIKYHSQIRDGIIMSRRPNINISNGQSYVLPTLINGGGILYNGGDKVNVRLICYFSNEDKWGGAILTVDGDIYIVVTGRCKCTVN